MPPDSRRPGVGPKAVASCRNCDAVLHTAREKREQFCSNIKCRSACITFQAKQAVERDKHWADSRQAHAEKILSGLQKHADVMAVIPPNPLLMIIPRNTRQVVKQPAHRVTELQRHLRRTMDQAEIEINNVGLQESIQKMHEDRIRDAAPSLPVLNACITCAGHCCLQGAGTALLNRDFFAWRLLKETNSTPQQIVEEYLSLIPEYAFEDSCLYHTEDGCVLPRKIRSSTCNNFQCRGITDGVGAQTDKNSSASVAVSDTNETLRIGIVKTDGRRTEFQIRNG